MVGPGQRLQSGDLRSLHSASQQADLRPNHSRSDPTRRPLLPNKKFLQTRTRPATLSLSRAGQLQSLERSSRYRMTPAATSESTRIVPRIIPEPRICCLCICANPLQLYHASELEACPTDCNSLGSAFLQEVTTPACELRGQVLICSVIVRVILGQLHVSYMRIY